MANFFRLGSASSDDVSEDVDVDIDADDVDVGIDYVDVDVGIDDDDVDISELAWFCCRRWRVLFMMVPVSPSWPGMDYLMLMMGLSLFMIAISGLAIFGIAVICFCLLGFVVVLIVTFLTGVVVRGNVGWS